MRALALAGLVASVGALGASVAVGGSGGLLAGAVAAGVFVASLRTFFLGGGAAAASPGGSSESRFLVKVVGAAFALRIAATILLHYGDLWRYLGGDEETFDLNARVFANWVAGQSSIPLSPRFLGSVEVGYFYLVGSLYHTFGVHKFLPLLLNALLGASLVLPVHALAGRFAGRVAARRAAILIAIFPSLVLWSSLMVRDVLALFAIAAVLLQTDRLRKSPSPARLLAVLGGVFAEGVDYPGEMLSDVIVVSPALPQVGPERELLKAYYAEQYERGFEYAYLIPGMRRVVQAAGRLIRSEHDRGAIVLICKRFLREPYVSMLPTAWTDGSPATVRSPDPVESVREFFASLAQRS